jgi:hypothetical protein
MTVDVRVTFSDGTNTVVTFEKPPGYHPMSTYIGELGVQQAAQQQPGKTAVLAERINGNTPHHNGVVWQKS